MDNNHPQQGYYQSGLSIVEMDFMTYRMLGLAAGFCCVCPEEFKEFLLMGVEPTETDLKNTEFTLIKLREFFQSMAEGITNG